MSTMKEILGLTIICFTLFNYIWALAIMIKCIIRRDWKNFAITAWVLIIMVVFTFK